MKKLRQYWHSLTHIGGDASMSYMELKRVNMVNLIALACLPMMLTFSIVNYHEQRPILAMVNLLNTLSAAAVLGLQLIRQHAIARAVLVSSNYVFFTFSALFYQNGAEYFLLCILVVSVLIYKNRTTWTTLGIIMIGTIIVVTLFPQEQLMEAAVPPSRIIINLFFALLFILIALSFFKQIIHNNTTKIEEQRQRLHKLNLDKEKVFSIVAHDLRGPLVTLQEMLSSFRRELLSGELTGKDIDELHRQVKRQNESLFDLLQWSSRSMHGIIQTPREIFVYSIVSDIIALFEPIYNKKKLTFSINIAPDTLLYADKDQLIIIFRNIISNAIKFSHEGGHISIYTLYETQFVSIHVEDRGLGMSENKVKSLFSTAQAPSLGTADESGLGLGLLLCHELIKQNNGHIHIQSAENKGTIFTITFPAIEHTALSLHTIRREQPSVHAIMNDANLTTTE